MMNTNSLTPESLHNFARYVNLLDSNLKMKNVSVVCAVQFAPGVVSEESITHDAFVIATSDDLPAVFDEIERLDLGEDHDFKMLLCFGAVSLLRKSAQA